MESTPLYGKHSDTGDIVVRASIVPAWRGYQCRVEVWTSRAIGKEQNRAHCMELTVREMLEPRSYERAYAEILGTYRSFWKESGIVPDPNWESALAFELGAAADRYRPLTVN